MRLPGHQVRQGETWPAKWLIKPNTKVMKRDLHRQTRLKTAEILGLFPVQAQGMGELVVDGLDHLPHFCQPAMQALGPGPLTIAFRRTDHACSIEASPRRMIRVLLKSLVHHIR